MSFSQKLDLLYFSGSLLAKIIRKNLYIGISANIFCTLPYLITSVNRAHRVVLETGKGALAEVSG
jgi:hypothetical protein